MGKSEVVLGIFGKWRTYMSGSAITAISYFAAKHNESNAWLVLALKYAAIGFFVVAVLVFAWEEHKKRVEAEKALDSKKPRLQFVADTRPAHRWFTFPATNEALFNLVLINREPAQYIQVDPILSSDGKISIVFDQVDFLTNENENENCFEHLKWRLYSSALHVEYKGIENLRHIFLDRHCDGKVTMPFPVKVSFRWKDTAYYQEFILEWNPITKTFANLPAD